jgi:hypothetical protein
VSNTLTRFTSIPDPAPNMQAMMVTVSALKQTVEQMAGLIRSIQPNATNYYQALPPKSPNIGDIWISSDTGAKVFWSGSEWLAL